MKSRFGKFELRMLRRIVAWNKKNPTCSPKKKQLIYADYRNDKPIVSHRKDGTPIFHGGITDRRAFKNLEAGGYIRHSRNGHCFIKHRGKLALTRSRR